MRTGPGLARGGCRALKWAALFGAACAAGAGSASAQFTVSGPRTVDEGRSLVLDIVLKYRKAAGSNAVNVFRIELDTSPGSTGVSNVGRVGGLTAAETVDYRWVADNAGGGVFGNAGTEAVTDTLRYRIVLNTRSDPDAEDEAILVTPRLTWSFGANSGLTGQDGRPLTAPAPFVVRIEDDEEQTFEWETPAGAAAGAVTSLTEGTAVTRTLKTAPDPANMTWNVSLFVNEAGYALDAGTVSFTSAATEHAVTMTPPNPDGDREDDTIELHARVGGTDDPLPGIDEPLEFEFEDLHALPAAGRITAQAYEDREGAAAGRTSTEASAVTEGGEPVHVRVTVDRGSDGHPLDEKLVVTPRVAPSSPAGAADFEIAPSSIEIAAGRGRRSADFVLTARADGDVGAETLDLELVTKGGKPANGPDDEVVGTFSIDIVDATARLVAPKPDAAAEAYVMEAMGEGPLNPGDSFTLDVTELFDWAPAAVDVAFAAAVRGPAVRVSTSGETVTVEAKEAGEAVVTVTATAADKGSPAVGTSQTVANAASVTFDVRVVLADLAIMLSAPDLNVVEGGPPVRVTATADRAVTKDTTVRLDAVGGSASPGDYTVGDVTIEAGAEEGAAELTATDDEADERSETLTLRGVFVDDESGKDGETGTLTFHLWDAAVPALPAAASLLLAALLAAAGYRRLRRR